MILAPLSTLGAGVLAIGTLDIGGFLTGSQFIGAIGQAIITILTNLFALILGTAPVMTRFPTGGFF